MSMAIIAIIEKRKKIVVEWTPCENKTNQNHATKSNPPRRASTRPRPATLPCSEEAAPVDDGDDELAALPAMPLEIGVLAPLEPVGVTVMTVVPAESLLSAPSLPLLDDEDDVEGVSGVREAVRVDDDGDDDAALDMLPALLDPPALELEELEDELPPPLPPIILPVPHGTALPSGCVACAAATWVGRTTVRRHISHDNLRPLGRI